jgi:hypothetical protein
MNVLDIRTKAWRGLAIRLPNASLSSGDDQRIVLQSVRTCQQVFSAAFIAHVEAAYSDDAVKNDLCVPIAHPHSDLDWLRTTIANNRNLLRWAEDGGLQTLLDNARLDGFRHLRPQLPSEPQARAHALKKMGEKILGLNAKLEKLLCSHARQRRQISRRFTTLRPVKV